MPDNLTQLLEKAGNTLEGRIAAGHLAVQVEILNKMFDDEASRDAACILAVDWLEHGSPLRKAAAQSWAKEKHIEMGDKADPDAKAPTPNDLSNGIDAPDSGNRAAGAGAAGNEDQKNPDDTRKPEGKPAAKGDTIAKLRHLAARRAAPALATNATTAGAYEAGYRDATKKHADAAHRIGAMATRHAFKLGAQAGHHMGSKAQADAQAGAGGLPVTQQQVITHPGMGKSDRARELAKLAGG